MVYFNLNYPRQPEIHTEPTILLSQHRLLHKIYLYYETAKHSKTEELSTTPIIDLEWGIFGALSGLRTYNFVELWGIKRINWERIIAQTHGQRIIVGIDVANEDFLAVLMKADQNAQVGASATESRTGCASVA